MNDYGVTPRTQVVSVCVRVHFFPSHLLASPLNFMSTCSPWAWLNAPSYPLSCFNKHCFCFSFSICWEHTVRQRAHTNGYWKLWACEAFRWVENESNDRTNLSKTIKSRILLDVFNRARFSAWKNVKSTNVFAYTKSMQIMNAYLHTHLHIYIFHG